MDILVEDQLLIELESQEKPLRIPVSPLLTDLKLPGIKSGLRKPFNGTRLKECMKRSVLGFPS